LNDFDERTQANLDIVLDEICSELPHGGDHESRKAIAEQLMQAARDGRTSLRDLTYVGRRALTQILQQATVCLAGRALYANRQISTHNV
jgi:hypothetical protein